MQLSEIFLGLGQEALPQLLRSISMGKLRTYQLFDIVKTRAHLGKLNSENLRKAAPRLWTRLEAREDELAQDLAQAILVSHLEMIVQVLNFLGVPHEEGFFAKDMDARQYLTEGWRERAYEEFREKWPEAVLLFYLNHLAAEMSKDAVFFAGAAKA
ncbi:MAG TPA: hypothetical protein DEH78_05630 [Solibacterales bacterium]|nr:hypothetical protein [Bryobacterales bacterium]